MNDKPVQQPPEMVMAALFEGKSSDEQKALLATLERSGAALCGLVGHTVTLYRPNPDEPAIELPQR